MSGYIDVIKLKSDMMEAIRLGYNAEDMLSIVDEQDTADVVEVVRCNDCLYYNGNNKWCDCAVAQSGGYCSRWKRIEVKK